MGRPTKLPLAALLLIGLAGTSASDAAPHTRPAKIGKSQKSKTELGTAPQAGTRRSATSRKIPTRPLRVRQTASKIANKGDLKSKAQVPEHALKLRDALGKAIEANLKKFPGQKEFLPTNRVLYHSIKESNHRELWKGKYESQGLDMIGEWMTGGRYGGIWTTPKKAGLFGGEGWYSDKGARAVRITLKKSATFIDLDDPVQKQIYKDWKKLSGQDKQSSPKDLFQTMKGPDGLPMAKRIGGIGAPIHGDFLVHMGVAGVIHYDTYGQGNPVLINPHAIEKVEF